MPPAGTSNKCLHDDIITAQVTWPKHRPITLQQEADSIEVSIQRSMNKSTPAFIIHLVYLEKIHVPFLDIQMFNLNLILQTWTVEKYKDSTGFYSLFISKVKTCSTNEKKWKWFLTLFKNKKKKDFKSITV